MPYKLPAHRADGDPVAGPEEGRKAVLADAEVAARQDHDALLLVLADDTKLVLPFAFDLNQWSYELQKNYTGSLKREVNKYEGLKGREIKLVLNPLIGGAWRV